jgi:PIN domain nuclease of toxin-antitoxin system
MIVYVLDSSAVLRFIDNEAGVYRVDAIFSDCDAGNAMAWISAVQWGELATKFRKKFGPGSETEMLRDLLPSRSRVIPVDAEQAIRAGILRADHGIAYADAFALDLAMKSTEHILVTADYGFKAVEDLAQIEFLPAK